MGEKFTPENLPVESRPESEVDRDTLETKTETVLTPEEETAIYNQIVELVASAKKLGVKNPYNLEDERMTPTLDLIEEWEMLHGVSSNQPPNIDTREKALLLVKARSIFVEAGFESKKDVENAVGDLRDELIIYLRQADPNTEIVAILKQGIANLENRLEKNPSKLEMVDDKISLAQTEVEQGKLISAIGTLTSMLTDPRFKTFLDKNPDKKNEIIRQSLQYKMSEAIKLEDGGKIADAVRKLNQLPSNPIWGPFLSENSDELKKINDELDRLKAKEENK